MTASFEKRRFPRRLYLEGSEPDPRFSLANERTFLAWIRTALALLAAAVALLALELPLTPSLQLIGAGLFAISAFVATAWAYFSWVATERALRHERPLPGFGAGAGIAILVMLAIAALMIGAANDDFGELLSR